MREIKFRVLKELQAKATPGPWAWWPKDGEKTMLEAINGGMVISSYVDGCENTVLDFNNEADAELITLLRNNLPALLEVVEVLQALNRRGGLGLMFTK